MKLEIKCQECGEICIEELDVTGLTWHRCPKRDEGSTGHLHSVFIVEVEGDTIKIY